jgi:hypothetical protein
VRNSLRAFIVMAGVGATGIGAAPVGGAAPIPVAPSRSWDLPRSPMSQQNAVQKAQQYLAYTSFSRLGLIQQLEYDDFSTSDATYAVDSLSVDWNAQAVKKAQQYLNYTSFSRQGLIEQLEYDNFTASQAAYGVSAAYG